MKHIHKKTQTKNILTSISYSRFCIYRINTCNKELPNFNFKSFKFVLSPILVGTNILLVVTLLTIYYLYLFSQYKMERKTVPCPSTKAEGTKPCGFELFSCFNMCPICGAEVKQKWFQEGKSVMTIS